MMPFNVTADKITSEGLFLKWTKVSATPSSYLVTLEDDEKSCEVCYVVSGSETELYMDYPIKAGRNYTARVKAYVETAIGQPGANYGLVSPIGYSLLQQKSLIITTGTCIE